MKLHTGLARALCALMVASCLIGCASQKPAKQTAKHKTPVSSTQTADSGGKPAVAKPSTTTTPADGADIVNELFGGDKKASAPGAKPGVPVAPGARPIAPGARPTPQQLLGAVQALYRSSQSLKVQFTGSLVTKSDGKVVQNRSGVTSAVIFKRPAMFSLSDGYTRTMSDGKTIVNYVISAKRYTKAPVTKDILRAIVMGNPGVSTLGLVFGVDYASGMISMKLLPDSKVGKRDTYVLALRIKTPKGASASQKLWIGKKDLVICRNEIVTEMRPTRPKGYKGQVPKLIATTLTGTLVSITPNPKLPDSTFKFTAPAGVSEVGPPKKVDLTGKPAPDFSFKWTDGSAKKLSDFRGKPVILEFWAMPMASKQLPALQSVFEKHKDDAQVISINFNSDSAKLGEYLKSKNLSFPIVYGDQEIAKVASQGYSLMALPTVFIIDEQGIIRGMLAGDASEKAIEAELDKLKGAQ